MAYIRVNVVYLTDDKPYRDILVFWKDITLDKFKISPRYNYYYVDGEYESLATFREQNCDLKKSIFLKFVESIYIDDIKVFDYTDYDYGEIIKDGKRQCELKFKGCVDEPILYKKLYEVV